MGDTRARKPFCDDANQDTQHCCSAVEQFYAFELFQQNQFFGPMLKPFSASRSVCHFFATKKEDFGSTTRRVSAIRISGSDQLGD